MGYVLPYREILLIWVLVDTNGTAIPTPRWGKSWWHCLHLFYCYDKSPSLPLLICTHESWWPERTTSFRGLWAVFLPGTSITTSRGFEL